MKGIKTFFVTILAVIAVILFPLGVISFIAAESALTQVTFVDGGEVMQFLIGADTVDGFFHEAGISRTSNDRLSHSPDALLWDGIIITIEREIPIYVQIDEGAVTLRNSRPGATVADILRQMQEETDTALLYRGNAEVQIQRGQTIHFDSWRARLETELIRLPYATIENHTNAVSRGRQHLRVEGVDGEKEITTSIVYIGGVEDNRAITSEEITREPIDAILDIGTAWLGSLTNTSAPDFHYFRRIRMEATAYTSGYGCTGKHPWDPWYGITASGRHVEHGIVAVDRNIIPLGTRLYVEGHGFSIAADVGGAIRGNKIDLFMYDLEDALRFGRRHLYVWILDEI
ncbi:MAG: 3D domain-containing protein [Defluviitaleaceae bacterium]|nr:3D domain-containing protein [Defluviitaleaceae bacterium]